MSNGSIIGMTNPSLARFKANGVWTLTEQFNLFKSGGWPGGALYSFTSVLFNAGLDASRDPPTKQNIIDNITSTSLSSFQNNTDLFDVSNGIITWKVPESGTYRIIAKGAAGGQSTNWGPQGGFGAIITGDFGLAASTVLKILVGQRGTPNTYEGGGGGGTFVTFIDNTPLIIAGGGGAGSASGFNGTGSKNANLTGNGYSTAYATGGTNGNGGGGYSNAGGGGGLTGNGTGTWFGRAFTNGGLGGEGNGGAPGGFGGGGGGGGTNGAPGGGGYSGGAAAAWSYEGAGGGSFNSGSNPLAVLNTVYEIQFFIQIKDGAPFEHPILKQNLFQAFPDLSFEELSQRFLPFKKTVGPILNPYEKIAREEYVLEEDNIVYQRFVVEEMTEEEKIQKQNLIKSTWNIQHRNNPEMLSWIFNEETGMFEPPNNTEENN